jgi:hypothetical protein
LVRAATSERVVEAGMSKRRSYTMGADRSYDSGWQRERNEVEYEILDWRVPDQEFWKRWHTNKEAMKAEGYRVTRGDDGQ